MKPVNPGEIAMGARILNKSAYAEHRGCAPSYITKLIKTGKLTAPALRDDGKILVELADKMLAGGEVEAPAAPSTQPDGPKIETRAEAEARKAREDADARSMQNAQRRGELCDTASVRDAGEAIGQALQQALTARRRDLAMTLSAETDFNRVLAAIEDADRALLMEIAENVQRNVAKLDAAADADAA